LGKRGPQTGPNFKRGSIGARGKTRMERPGKHLVGLKKVTNTYRKITVEKKSEFFGEGRGNQKTTKKQEFP